MTLINQLQDDMKSAMRAKDRERLSVLRMVLAAVKQREVDDRIQLDDAGVLAVVDKMVKQRRDAESQYREANRDDLADAEAAEIVVLESYLPEQLDAAELDRIIDEALDQSGAESMRDMGKVMGLLKPKVQGRADMGAVSKRVKEKIKEKS